MLYKHQGFWRASSLRRKDSYLVPVEDTIDVTQYRTKRQKNEEYNEDNRDLKHRRRMGRRRRVKLL